MASDSLTLSQILSRIESLTQSGSVNFGHWNTARKTDLANEAQLEVFRNIVRLFEDRYFCEIENVTPAGNVVSLDALPRRHYATRAFQKQIGSNWINVKLLSQRDSQTLRQRNEETWYEIGHTLRSDNYAALTGTYRVIYIYYPKTLVNDADPTEIDPEYVDMVPLFGAAQACIQAKANDSYQTLMLEYTRRLTDMQRTAQNRNLARTRRIVDTLGYRPAGKVFLFDNRVP